MLPMELVILKYSFRETHKANSGQLTLNTAKFQRADSLASLSLDAFCSELVIFFSPLNSAFVFLLKVRQQLSSLGGVLL